MGNLFSCFRLISRSRPSSQSSQVGKSSGKGVYVVPDLGYTLQPYLPMSPDKKYDIYLEDGDNERVPVVAFLDSGLKHSLISKKIALQTKAEVVPLKELELLQDGQGRRFTCDSKIISLSWYLASKQARTFEETFYVFPSGDVDEDVIFRADIEPHPAEVRDDDTLYVLAPPILSKEDKLKQKEYEENEAKKRQKEQEDRRRALEKKYGSNKDNTGSGSQGFKTDSTP